MARRISKVTIRHTQACLAVLFPSVKITVCNGFAEGKNAVPELWVRDSLGYGFALTLGAGPAGISATIHKFTGGSPISVSGNKDKTFEALQTVDMFEVSACAYRNDAYAQQFKGNYIHEYSGR